MKSLENALKTLLGGFIICSGYFGIFNYSSYDQQKKFLQNVKREYQNEIAKERIEIYKSLPFTSKVYSFGAYLVEKENKEKTNKK